MTDEPCPGARISRDEATLMNHQGEGSAAFLARLTSAAGRCQSVASGELRSSVRSVNAALVTVDVTCVILISTGPVSLALRGSASRAGTDVDAASVENGLRPAASQISLVVLLSGTSKTVVRTRPPSW